VSDNYEQCSNEMYILQQQCHQLVVGISWLNMETIMMIYYNYNSTVFNISHAHVDHNARPMQAPHHNIMCMCWMHYILQPHRDMMQCQIVDYDAMLHTMHMQAPSGDMDASNTNTDIIASLRYCPGNITDDAPSRLQY
jgi:hypothetical protein